MIIYTRLAQIAAALSILVLVVAHVADFTPVATGLLLLSVLAAALPYGLSSQRHVIRSRAAADPKKLQPSFALTKATIGKTTYTAEALQKTTGIALFNKVLALLLKSDLTKLQRYESTLRMHGGQHITYLYGPAAAILEGSHELWDHEHVRKLTAADRTRLNGYAGLAYRLHGDAKSTYLGTVEIADTSKQTRNTHVTQQATIVRHGLARAVRINLATCGALLALVALSVFGLAIYHVQPSITVLQILVVTGLLIMPICALAYDDAAHALSKARPHTPLLFGAITAIVSYANYLFYFFRQSLSPAYLDTGLPQYLQATTITLATVVLCTFAYILLERADSYRQFFDMHLFGNTKLNQAFGISFVLLLAIIYAPPCQWLFTTQPLSLTDWCSVIVATGVYILIRLLQRHTRKHTRHSVLSLHREIHG